MARPSPKGKYLAEEAPFLDISLFQHTGVFDDWVKEPTTGSFVWRDGGGTEMPGMKVAFKILPASQKLPEKARQHLRWLSLDISFEAEAGKEEERVKQGIWLIDRQCNFGGRSWFFICDRSRPGPDGGKRFCKARAQKVFWSEHGFCCRRCSGVTYRSMTRNKREKKLAAEARRFVLVEEGFSLIDRLVRTTGRKRREAIGKRLAKIRSKLEDNGVLKKLNTLEVTLNVDADQRKPAAVAISEDMESQAKRVVIDQAITYDL